MLKWWTWYILLISQCYRVQLRSIIDDSCTLKSPADMPKRCILHCVQLLYDNEFCKICENDSAASLTNGMENEETLVDKRKPEWCAACVPDQWQINSSHYDSLLRHITNFFDDLELSWCNDALNFNAYNEMDEHDRTKRYNPGIAGSPYRHPSTYSSKSYSETGMIVGMVIFGIFLLCALGFLCRSFAKNLDLSQSYAVNS